MNYILELPNQNIICNFSPSDAFKKELRNVCDRTSLFAPSDSMLKAIVRNLSNKQTAVSLRVASKEGAFVANAVQKTPEMALHEAEKIIKEKVKDWVSNRLVVA